jgi:hypothetical protein
MRLKQCEIEAIIDNVIEDIVEVIIAGEFSTRREFEYALEYLKTKIDDIEPTDFLE